MKRFWQWLRFGTITEHITGIAGDHVPAEIEYRGRGGRVVGFWAYGYWHPNYPFRGPYLPYQGPDHADTCGVDGPGTCTCGFSDKDKS